MSVFDNIVFLFYPDYIALVVSIATTAEHCRDTSHSRTKFYCTWNRIFKLFKNSNQSEPIDKFSLPNFIQVICLVRIVCWISLRILVPAAWRRALHCRLQVLTPPTNNWKWTKCVILEKNNWTEEPGWVRAQSESLHWSICQNGLGPLWWKKGWVLF